MSAIGQILDAVETRVRELLTKVTEHERKQDKRLDDLEAAVARLESATGGSAARKATAPAATARAGTAKASGKAQP